MLLPKGRSLQASLLQIPFNQMSLGTCSIFSQREDLVNFTFDENCLQVAVSEFAGKSRICVKLMTTFARHCFFTVGNVNVAV